MVGATYPLEIERVGAQGGDAVATVRAGWRKGALIIVNSSRAILYASSEGDYAEAARREALKTRHFLHAVRQDVAKFSQFVTKK